MNSLIRFSAIAMAVASLAACVREVPAPTPNPRPEIEVKNEAVLTDMSFEARLGESRSSVWAGQVMVYDNVATHEACTFEVTQVNGSRAVLKGKAYNPADMYYALYPANAFGTFQNGIVAREIPENQVVKATDGELAPEAQVAFAQALSKELKFSPVAAYVRFTVSTTNLVSFTLRAADDKDIAGQTEIDVFSKEINLVGAKKSIKVTPDGEKSFENKIYAVEVLPGEYKDGFVAELTFEDGSTHTNTFSNAVEIKTGDVLKIGEITGFVDPGDAWTDITAVYGADNNISFGKIKMYKNEKLNGFDGNVGYLFTIPAGQVGMKVACKAELEAANRKISGTLRAHREYTLFIPYQGPGDIYRPNGSTQQYLSPVEYGPDRNGETKVLRANDGWANSTKAYAPAIGIKDGKVQIRPAITKNNKIYCYSDVKGSDEQEWDVEAAMGGMFHLVHNGEALISAETDEALDTYSKTWLATPSLTTRLINGQAWVPISTYAKYRHGRVLVGCTAEGSLVIVAVEKIVDWDNTGRLEDAGHNGLNGDTRGVTMYEAAQLMKNLGCSDAMTVEDLNWGHIILQDGGQRGVDLFKTYRRYDLRGNGAFRGEDFEMENLVTLCVKAL